jgi:YD repeat-containing protein
VRSGVPHRNQVWKFTTNRLARFLYQLGTAGNRTNLSDTVNGSARTYAWKYDNLYRLTNETINGSSPFGSVGYRYDRVGNRTNRTSTITGVVTNQTFSYTTNDWLTSDGYDNNGNTTNSAGATYRYDWANRLTNYVNGTTNLTIVYDADGNRMSKTLGAATTLYLVGLQNLTGYAQVLEELIVSGGATNLTRAYTYGPDLISQRHSNGAVQFYGYDAHGSVRFLFTTNGAISDTYAYDSYGLLIGSIQHWPERASRTSAAATGR